MKEKINRDNYERYFAEYLDGALPASEQAAFDAFLLLNQDLAEQLEDLDLIRLSPSVIPFEKKEKIRKKEHEEWPDYYAIASAEDVLPPREKEQAERILHQPGFSERVDQYRSIRIYPDPTVRFEKKKQLYKKSPVIPFLAGISGAAAILFIFFATGLFSGPREEQPAGGESFAVARELFSPLPPSSAIFSGLPLADHLPATLSFRAPDRHRIEPPMELSVNIYATLEEEEIPPLVLSPVSPRYAQELTLNESAREWKPSGEGFNSRNIFSSVIDAGKQLAERLKEPAK